MPLGNPTGGASYAAEFQSSALPWMITTTAPAAGAPNQHKFQMVSRFVTLVNSSSGSISLAVTRAGIISSGNKVIVPAGMALTFEWRVTQVFVQSESGGGNQYSLAAGLTTIPPQNYFQITGSAPDGTNWPGVG